MNRIAALLPLLAAAILSGCGEKSASPIQRSLLIGRWAPPGATCQIDCGIIYLKDGTWAAYNESGDWTLRGDRLTLRVTERGGTDQPGRTVKDEKPIASTIVSLSKTELVERRDDGKTITLQRRLD